ncbi:hypothetical protein F4804DRAFT_346662 [Jackrogersella minutella]|nr:hypothetical protein F4804DRAFT_346662 [Jackrogersella minutella]
MFATLVRRMGEGPFQQGLNSAARLPPTRIYTKKIWPPDFSKLSEKEKFRFERRYKRRVKLATARPRWDKYVRLAQLFSISFILVYTVLFMDWNTKTQPLQGIRNSFWGTIDAFSPEKRHPRPTLDTPTNPK